MAPERALTSPAGTVSQPIGKPFNGQAKGLLWLTWRSYAGPPQYFITPEGESPQPACKAKPITGRTLGAQGQRPGGAINPHTRKGVSTFGNTGKHRPAPDPDRATGLLPYPRATSNVIITMKPRAKVRTPISECSPSDISGISSSTTTYIMAPAAKERR